MAEPTTPSSGESLMNYALRMVIPIKREFGRSLDVQHFLHDLAYAKEVLDEARQSQNPKLREYAEYLNSRLLGPRNAAAPAPGVSQRLAAGAAASAPAPGAQSKAAQASEDEEARQLLLAKYRSGLR
jgi:hypothetical protein